MTLLEQLVSIVIVCELSAIAMLSTTGLIGYAKVTGAMVQLQQTAKQSQYDAIVNYGQVRSVAIYGGDNPAITECLDGVCSQPVPLPSGIVVKSTFRGIDAKVAGDGVPPRKLRATLISWSSETAAGIGGSYGQHGTITFSHPMTRKRFCLVRGGATGNQGIWSIRKDKECK
jgi:type II secretory pathway pseudopilin PulG